MNVPSMAGDIIPARTLFGLHCKAPPAMGVACSRSDWFSSHAGVLASSLTGLQHSRSSWTFSSNYSRSLSMARSPPLKRGYILQQYTHQHLDSTLVRWFGEMQSFQARKTSDKCRCMHPYAVACPAHSPSPPQCCVFFFR